MAVDFRLSPDFKRCIMKHIDKKCLVPMHNNADFQREERGLCPKTTRDTSP